MMETDIFGYKQEEDGTYTVLKNNESFIHGITDAVEAAKIVDLLIRDGQRLDNGDIRSLGEPELLCQLAEEASELAQAALKLRRVLEGKNPTPCTESECRENLTEEVADVDLLFKLCGLVEDGKIDHILEIEMVKKKRWEERLKNHC